MNIQDHQYECGLWKDLGQALFGQSPLSLPPALFDFELCKFPYLEELIL